MSDPREARAAGVSGRWWAGLLVAAAAWEVFLRVDSRVLAPSTKLWFFPLLLATFVLVGGALVRVVAAAGGVVLGVERASVLARPVFALVAGGVVGLEYAFLTFHHPVASVKLAPVVAVGVAVLAWLATGVAGGARVEAERARRSTALVVLAACIASAAFAAAFTRPDVGTALLRRNTAFGRLLGHSLARVPRHVRATGTITRPPDLVATRSLGRSNVIVLSIDTLRQDALGTYGKAGDPSPRLDALAAGSVVFADAYAQVPSSAPSVATMMTGTYPMHHGVRENRMALDFAATTLAETLAAAGYATAGFVTNSNFAPGTHLDQGFATYHLLLSNESENGLLLDASDGSAVDAALAWAKAAPPRPVMLWVHVMAPHSPYVPPRDLRPELHPGSGPWFDVWNMGGDARVATGRSYFDLGVYTTLYAAEVRSADRLAGRLFDGLAALGLLDDAHVLVFADHGEAFGENDVFAHGRSLDPAETRVPLIWRLPHGLRAGTRIATTTQLADVTPTLLRLLGIAPGAPVDGRDLSAVLLGESPEDDGFAFTQARFLHSMGVKGLLYGVRTRTRMLWIDAGYGYDGEYDRRADPGEERMRAYSGNRDDPLRRTLETMAQATQESLHRPALRGAVDPQQIEQLRALGYVQ